MELYGPSKINRVKRYILKDIHFNDSTNLVHDFVDNLNLSNKYNRNIQKIFLNHILSFLLIENTNNILLSNKYINKKLELYVKSSVIDKDIGMYIEKLKSVL